MNHTNDYSHKIDILNSTYLQHKRLIKEVEEGTRPYDYMKVRYAHNVVKHMENVAADLSDNYRLIIEKEVFCKEKGSKWYLEFFTMQIYYRIRKKAYKTFIDNLNK